jgi:hypothetical protein
MSTPRQVTFNFTASGQNSPALRVDANNRLVFGCRGGNATLDLQTLADDGTTWVAVRFPNTATAAQFATTAVGAVVVDVTPGQYRITCSAHTSAKTGYLWVNQ